LLGPHQRRNAAVAREILAALPAGWQPGAAAIETAFARARVPGRLDRRGRWLFDVAHNPDGMDALVRALEDLRPPRPLHALVSILGDKEWPEMLVRLDALVDRGILTIAPTAEGRGWDLGWLSEWLARPDRPPAHAEWHLEPDFERALRDVQVGAGTVTDLLHPTIFPPMPGQALPGFRDFYPDDLALRTYIFRTWREVARRYGFEEYDGPPLEPLELYTEKSGAEIVGQLYNFEDKGGRSVALRPEMTPTLARMVAARINGLKKPVRWFSIPQLFRYERQQRGRLREHFQLNCDLIGEAGPLADVEIIALAVDVMRAFGLGPSDVRVRLSDRRVLTALLKATGVADPQLDTAYQAIDKLERANREQLASQLHGAGLSGRAIEGVFHVARLRGREEIAEILGGASDDAAAALESLDRTISGLNAMGLGDFVDVDLGIVRGLAYYTGTVFELFDAGHTLRAICGGGRYDDLLRNLGGVDVPALGFGMGDVVLGELLKERSALSAQRSALDVFVAGVSPEDEADVLALVHECRDAGLSVEFALGSQALGKQFKLADARGPDDRARGEVMVKDLEGGEQRGIARDAVVRTLATARGRG
jgi:histidyl-tRNA synthetase